MDFVKAQEILEALRGLDPDSKETILKALGIAEHIERSSLAFYKKESERTKDSELGPFFGFLVKEENMHLDRILKLKGMLERGELEKVYFDRNEAPAIHSIQPGRDEMTALLYALWREKKAVDFYSGAAEKSEGEVKDFFKELADFEKEHVQLFEEYVENAQNVNELIMG